MIRWNHVSCQDMLLWGCVRTNRIIICWGKTQNLQWSQMYVVTFMHNTRTLTDTHMQAHLKQGFGLIMRRIWHLAGMWCLFLCLFLPQFPLTTTPCVLTNQERESERRRGPVKKMERWRKREQPTDHIMVVASVILLIHTLGERLEFDCGAYGCL